MNEVSEREDIKISEYQCTVISEEAADYILNSPLKNTVSIKDLSKEKLLEVKSYVGFLNLPGNKNIYINPKINNLQFLELLKYSLSVNCNDSKNLFYYDSSRSDFWGEGTVFLYFIAEMFVSEMEKILGKGLYKEYVRKEEDLQFLKGKLDINKQIQRNFTKLALSCRYYDLTYNNLTNQAMLFAADKLDMMLRDESGTKELHLIRERILRMIDILSDEIDMPRHFPRHYLSRIVLSKKNEHYAVINELIRMIIDENFYSDYKSRKKHCCNFLIDMNVLFERVVFGLLKEELERRQTAVFSVRDQSKYRVSSFVKMTKRNFSSIKPDIILFKDNNEVAVLDAKYKKNVSQSDYYQIIIYSLILNRRSKDLNKAFLINYAIEEEIGLKETCTEIICTDTGEILLKEISDELENIVIANYSLVIPGRGNKAPLLECLKKQIESFVDKEIDIKKSNAGWN